MIILGPINSLFGLPINVNVNVGQNKFKIDILRNVAKIANFRPKIGQMKLLSLNINGHPILTFFIFNCLFFRDKSIGVKIKALYLLV